MTATRDTTGMVFDKPSSLWHQRSFALVLQEKVVGQGTVWMYWAPHAESHQRDLTWKHLEGPCVALGAPLRPVFVWGLSDYSYIPKDLLLWAHENMWEAKTGSGLREEDVIAGSEIFLGRILSVSCSYTLLFVSLLSLHQLPVPTWIISLHRCASEHLVLLKLHNGTVS